MLKSERMAPHAGNRGQGTCETTGLRTTGLRDYGTGEQRTGDGGQGTETRSRTIKHRTSNARRRTSNREKFESGKLKSERRTTKYTKAGTTVVRSALSSPRDYDDGQLLAVSMQWEVNAKTQSGRGAEQRMRSCAASDTHLSVTAEYLLSEHPTPASLRLCVKRLNE
jgi:hypothetical protein